MKLEPRCVAWMVGLAAAATWSNVLADTFEPRAIAPEVGVEALTKGLSRQHLDRDLFASPYASVLFGSVDVYDVFPYAESRYFLAVTDPEWNRLVISDTKQRVLRSFDGKNSGIGALNSPHGIAVDEHQNVYVCDTDNNRIVVLELKTEFDAVDISAVSVIEGLSRPYDVSHSDAGTPFDPADDHLYVAETGKNQVVRLTREGEAFAETGRLGGLGSGRGRFAGPMAVAVGRRDGKNTGEVYVADVHNRRIVRLDDSAGELAWSDEMQHDAALVTSLDTDHWGQVYVTSPSAQSVAKFTPELIPIADLTEGMNRPRSFHVPFVNVSDHRDGSRTRMGKAHGLLVEEWDAANGIELWSLGLEIETLEAEVDRDVRAQFRLTDPAWVTVRLVEARSGEVIAVRENGFLAAGFREVRFGVDDLLRPIEPGAHLLVVEAKAGYDESEVRTAQTAFDLPAAPAELQMNRPFFLGSSPNPFRPQTQVRFYLPGADAEAATLSVFDLAGRRIFQSVTTVSGAGVHSLLWNGRDARGREVSSGVYYYRVEVGDQEWAEKMVRVQ